MFPNRRIYWHRMCHSSKHEEWGLRGAIWRGCYHIYLVASCWVGTGRALRGVGRDPWEGAGFVHTCVPVSVCTRVSGLSARVCVCVSAFLLVRGTPLLCSCSVCMERGACTGVHVSLCACSGASVCTRVCVHSSYVCVLVWLSVYLHVTSPSFPTWLPFLAALDVSLKSHPWQPPRWPSPSPLSLSSLCVPFSSLSRLGISSGSCE